MSDPNIDFSVGSDGDLCKVVILLTDQTQRDFAGIPHLLIEFGPDTNRMSAIVGLRDNGPNACQPEPVEYNVAIGRCE